MQVYDKTLAVNTTRHCEMQDITRQVAAVVSESGIKQGVCQVQCPHTTAAITINENADPSVVDDILLTLEELIPHHRPGYRHSEGNSDAHVKSSLFGCNELVPVKDGRMVLGTWQGIYFCEFDGSRNRKVFVQVRGIS